MTHPAPTWPHERPNYDSLAAVQGEAARWNVPGMTAAVLHDDTLVEFLEARLFAGDGEALESRPILRANGRLAERR